MLWIAGIGCPAGAKESCAPCLSQVILVAIPGNIPRIASRRRRRGGTQCDREGRPAALPGGAGTPAELVHVLIVENGSDPSGPVAPPYCHVHLLPRRVRRLVGGSSKVDIVLRSIGMYAMGMTPGTRDNNRWRVAAGTARFKKAITGLSGRHPGDIGPRQQGGDAKERDEEANTNG